MKPPTTRNRLTCGNCGSKDLAVSVLPMAPDGEVTPTTVWLKYECLNCGNQGRREVTKESMPVGTEIGTRKIVERG